MSTTAVPVFVQVPTSETAEPAVRRRNPQAPRSTRKEPRDALSGWACAVMEAVDSSGKWGAWLTAEPRLGGFACLEAVVGAWAREGVSTHEVVAGLTYLGARRGGDDTDAALAVTVLMDGAISNLQVEVCDLASVDDIRAAMWEVVRSAEPAVGARTPWHLVVRTRQRLTRLRLQAGEKDVTPAQWLGDDVRRLDGRSLMGFSNDGVNSQDESAQELADLLAWAIEIGVVSNEEKDLLLEMAAAEVYGLGVVDAQRLVGAHLGVCATTVRRRLQRVVRRLREAAPAYLAAIA